VGRVVGVERDGITNELEIRVALLEKIFLSVDVEKMREQQKLF